MEMRVSMDKWFLVLVVCFFLLNSSFVPLVHAGFAEGYKRYIAGDFEGAIPEFESVLKEDQHNEKAKKYLLNCLISTWEKYQREKNYRKALIYLQKAYDIDPENLEIRKLSVYAAFAEGVKKYNAGDFEGAIPDFEYAFEQDKGDEKAKKYLLECLLIVYEKYQREKNYKKASICLRKAYDIDPDNPTVKKLYETATKEKETSKKIVLGTSVESEGETYVRRKGGEKWEKVEPNSPLYPADTISTGKDSRCVIVFDEGTVIKIEADTELTFETLLTDDRGILKIFDINLVKGRTLYNVEKFVHEESRVRVRSGVCSAVVYGTEFMVNVEKDKTTEIAVFDGVVKVASLPKASGEKSVEVTLEKGKQTIVKIGKAPFLSTDLSEKNVTYSKEVLPQFRQYVMVSRGELEQIALRREEYIKQKQREKEMEEGNKIALEKIALACKEAEGIYQKGQYKLAQTKYGELLSVYPTDEEVKNIYNKLTRIADILPEATKNDKVSNLIRKGLTNYLSREGEPKTAINALRYAAQLEPINKKIEKLRELVESGYPDIAKAEKLTPGMDVVEQKLFVALNYIYDGRYDLAIDECNQVLEFEPENLLAFKRLGSAYFALGKKDKARGIWQKAAKIYPNDTELKQFLKE